MFEKARYILKNRKGSVIATIVGAAAIGLGLSGALKPIDEDYDDETDETEDEEVGYLVPDESDHEETEG